MPTYDWPFGTNVSVICFQKENNFYRLSFIVLYCYNQALTKHVSIGWCRPLCCCFVQAIPGCHLFQPFIFVMIGRTNFAIALQSLFIIWSSSSKAPEFHSSDKNYKLGNIVVETLCCQSMFPGFLTSRNIAAEKFPSGSK